MYVVWRSYPTALIVLILSSLHPHIYFFNLFDKNIHSHLEVTLNRIKPCLICHESKLSILSIFTHNLSAVDNDIMEALQLERIIFNKKNFGILFSCLLQWCTFLKVLKDFTTLLIIIDNKLRTIHFDVDFICNRAIIIVLFEKSHLVLLVYR